jgi:hypothetical protein
MATSRTSRQFKVFRNSEAPFTELFSLLTRCPNGDSELHSAIRQHADNAIEVMLRGVQSIGQLIGIANEKMLCDEINDIGHLINAVGNIAEALYRARSDAEEGLLQQIGSEGITKAIR